MQRWRIRFRASIPWLLALSIAGSIVASLAGCGRQPPPDTGAASEPAQEVLLLAAHLRANELNGFVHAAVPPELQPELQRAWREGRSRWPLDELPFGEKLPGLLSALAAPKAEANLRRGFDRQFANANGEIRSAATTLGLFGVKFIERDADLSAEERAHYSQLITSLSEWAKTAKLGDPLRARRAIAQLTSVARASGLREEADFARYGMDDALKRLGPVFDGFKSSLNQYGLDLNESLDEMTATMVSQQGDQARVRMRYPLAGKTIDTEVALERVGQRWYLRDYLRHARAAIVPTPPATGQPTEPLPTTAGEAPVQPPQPQPPAPTSS